MKNKLILHIFFTAIIIGSCTSFIDKKEGNSEINTSNNQRLIQRIELDAENNILELFKNEQENTIILQTKHNSAVISKIGFGNSEFVQNEEGLVQVDTLTFSENNKSYLITSYIKGSTYGAENYFLVFKKSQWLLANLPFNRARFYDVNKDGLDEIIEHKSQSDSIVYTFKSGLVLPNEK